MKCFLWICLHAPFFELSFYLLYVSVVGRWMCDTCIGLSEDYTNYTFLWLNHLCKQLPIHDYRESSLTFRQVLKTPSQWNFGVQSLAKAPNNLLVNFQLLCLPQLELKLLKGRLPFWIILENKFSPHLLYLRGFTIMLVGDIKCQHMTLSLWAKCLSFKRKVII